MPNIRPFISVITICYNAEKLLERTIKSVLEQTRREEIQYIIVDGGSKDNSQTIFNQYADKIDILVSEPDKGIYDAMNKGIRLAKGKYLCFMNAGDTFYNNQVIEKAIHVSQTNHEKSPPVLYGDTMVVDMEGNIIGPRKLSPPKDLNWRSFENGMLVCHQSFYPRRDLVPYYRDNLYRFSADVDWCIRILKKCNDPDNKPLLIEGYLTNYLNEGATTKNHKESLKERFKIMVEHYGWLKTIWKHFYFIFVKER